MSKVELDAVIATEPKVRISERWEPGRITRIDTKAGTFEQVNPLADRDELILQDVLCARPVVKERSKWNPFPPKHVVIGGAP